VGVGWPLAALSYLIKKRGGLYEKKIKRASERASFQDRGEGGPEGHKLNKKNLVLDKY
jgi:hypothetical protein